MEPESYLCILGLIVCTCIYKTDATRHCSETISLSSFKDTRLPVYQKLSTFSCGGHLIGWRTIGDIPVAYSLHLGVWIPNYGSQKLLTLLEPLNKSSEPGMEPLIVEAGDFMGLVLLNDSMNTQSTQSKLTPRKDPLPVAALNKAPRPNPATKNQFLVAVVPTNTTRGSVVNLEGISFISIPADFTLRVQIDYSGVYKTKWKSIKKHTKRDKSKKCSPSLTNCESCVKIKGKLVCSLCKDGFFGRTCKDPCHESCATCDQASGDCVRCAAGYFGPNCKDQCPAGCSPALGCNADSGCVQCRLGWQGLWCKEFVPSCDVGLFRGTNCKNTCPETCDNCNGTQVNDHCLVCKQGIQWRLCADIVRESEEHRGVAEEEKSTSVGGIVGAVVAVIILGAMLTGIGYYLIRRRRRKSAKNAVVLEALNGLPSRDALDETQRPCNPYVENLPTNTNQNRELPLPPGEDEDGYMAPQTKPDVTSKLLQEENQYLNEKSATNGPSPHHDDVYETIGDVEPIEETFE